LSAAYPDETRTALPADADGAAPLRPVLARWAALAGVLANVWLIGTFFLNWTWQAQLGSVAPLGLVWFAGWWRWQRDLDRFEVAELEYRIRHEASAVARHRAEVEREQPRGARALSEDPAFEACYRLRRAMERRAEAELALARLRSDSGGGWRRRAAARH